MRPAKCLGAGHRVTDEEDGVEDAERDEELVERTLHLGAPQHEDGQDVAQHPERTQDRRGQTRHPPLPSAQDLELNKRRKDYKARAL